MMCGRYQFSAAEYDELRSIWRNAWRRTGRQGASFPPNGEISPTQTAPVLIANGGHIVGDLQTWGMPRFGRTIINARAETVVKKPMFRRNILAQRCVVPATAYYEWDADHRKHRFALPDGPLYFAGLYDASEHGNCFVILTTVPNASVQNIHDRMPLILRREEVRPWLTDSAAALELLTHAAPPLRHTSLDGQLRFSDLLN